MIHEHHSLTHGHGAERLPPPCVHLMRPVLARKKPLADNILFFLLSCYDPYRYYPLYWRPRNAIDADEWRQGPASFFCGWVSADSTGCRPWQQAVHLTVPMQTRSVAEKAAATANGDLTAAPRVSGFNDASRFAIRACRPVGRFDRLALLRGAAQDAKRVPPHRQVPPGSCQGSERPGPCRLRRRHSAGRRSPSGGQRPGVEPRPVPGMEGRPRCQVGQADPAENDRNRHLCRRRSG